MGKRSKTASRGAADAVSPQVIPFSARSDGSCRRPLAAQVPVAESGSTVPRAAEFLHSQAHLERRHRDRRQPPRDFDRSPTGCPATRGRVASSPGPCGDLRIHANRAPQAPIAVSGRPVAKMEEFNRSTAHRARRCARSLRGSKTDGGGLPCDRHLKRPIAPQERPSRRPLGR